MRRIDRIKSQWIVFSYFTSCNGRPSLVVDILVIPLLCLAGQSRRARKPKTSLVEDPDEVVEPESSTNAES